VATVSYSWESFGSDFLNDTGTSGGQSSPAMGVLSNGSYFGAWEDPGASLSVQGRIVGADGVPDGTQFLVNSTIENHQFGPSVAGLTGGGAIVAFTDFSVDPGGDIRGRLFTNEGDAVDLDFAIRDGVTDDANPDVAALSDGGFAVAWQRDNGDDDVRMAIFEANGSVRASSFAVSATATLSETAPSVAGLTQGGRSVVAWSQEPAAGGDSEVCFLRFSKNGNALGGVVTVDTTGSVNEDAEVVGLADGGFAVAYVDNSWGTGDDVTVAFYNEDGSLRDARQRVNTVTDGTQDRPTLTALDNGFLLVGWCSGATLVYQAYDANGNACGTNFNVAGNVVNAEIGALSGGLIANVRSSLVPDAGNDQSIRTSTNELTRTTQSSALGESLTGDALRDTMDGNAGDDTLRGRENDDELDGGAGSDTLYGGSGADRITGLGGLDSMFGGSGKDRFHFAEKSDSDQAAHNADIIRDFGTGADIVDVYDIDASELFDGDQAFEFIGTAAFDDIGQLRVKQAGDDTVVEMNLTGGARPEMTIVLLEVVASSLQADDFDL
jgi:Ca2+-binding RTX toxin-like protein